MNVRVERDDSDGLVAAVIRDHYLHRWPHPLSLPFGYRLIVNGLPLSPDSRPWGFVVLKKPQHMRHIGLFGDGEPLTAWQVLDLARVWVHPVLQHTESGHALCMFSRMVGAVIRRAQADWLDHHPPRYPDKPYDIRMIISYCDLRHHDGTGYRASGFARAGLSRDRTKELYVRRLAAPRKRWQSQQLSLWQSVDAKHFEGE